MKKFTIKQFLNSYIPIVLWSGFIFLLSNQPVLPGPQLYTWDFIFKKCAHIFVYFVLFLLVNRGISIHFDGKSKKSYLALLFTIVYAMTDEFHQSFIPGRSSTIRDLGYDGLGMIIGWLKLHRYI